jgi:hypothetical protein
MAQKATIFVAEMAKGSISGGKPETEHLQNLFQGLPF